MNIIKAIGNVLEANEIDGILYTLAADAIVRTNDMDSGMNIARIACSSPPAK